MASVALVYSDATILVRLLYYIDPESYNNRGGSNLLLEYKAIDKKFRSPYLFSSRLETVCVSVSSPLSFTRKSWWIASLLGFRRKYSTTLYGEDKSASVAAILEMVTPVTKGNRKWQDEKQEQEQEPQQLQQRKLYNTTLNVISNNTNIECIYIRLTITVHFIVYAYIYIYIYTYIYIYIFIQLYRYLFQSMRHEHKIIRAKISWMLW